MLASLNDAYDALKETKTDTIITDTKTDTANKTDKTNTTNKICTIRVIYFTKSV